MSEKTKIEELAAEGYRAWNITCEAAYVVVAKTAEEALEFSRQAVSDDCYLHESFDAQPMTHLPATYDAECLAYGEPEITCEEAAKLPGGYNYKPAVQSEGGAA